MHRRYCIVLVSYRSIQLYQTNFLMIYISRFISQNSEKLYGERRVPEDQTNIKLDNDLVEEHAALLPPFEVFTNVDEDDRCRHFFDVRSNISNF